MRNTIARCVLILLACAAAPSLATAQQTCTTTVCLQWAGISGDVAADRCAIAKLDAEKLVREFDPGRDRTIADAPLPSRKVQGDLLQKASERVTRDCADNDASR